jgi:hypothetical protein
MHNQVINPLYNDLLSALADLNQLKQVVNHAFRREFDALENYNKSNGISDDIVSREAFGFDNPFSGSLEKYAFRTMTIDDLRRMTYWHKNSQYCWLLMSAYEEFEKFIKAAYFEAAGYQPRNLNKMLSYFSNNFKSIKSREEKNKFEIHLRIAVHLVEKMRHIIAHNQSKVIDESKFYEKIIADSGISDNNGFHKDFVSQFVYDGKIFILEVPANDHPVLKLYHDRYRVLVSYLISYAYLVNDAAN